jgi:uncharacterized membrane protein
MSTLSVVFRVLLGERLGAPDEFGAGIGRNSATLAGVRPSQCRRSNLTPRSSTGKGIMNRRLRTSDNARGASRVLLGGFLVFSGSGHLSFARKDFRAQVPELVTRLSPLDTDQVVLASGVAEIGLGLIVVFAPTRYRERVGNVAATFFTAVFPGNLAQLKHHRDAFGLDTDRKRQLRLLGQPILVAWALWSTRVRR